jgi:hypothetical protein
MRAVAAIACALALGAPQQPFKSGATGVSLNVSVRDRNRVVTGLTAADFVVTDNGVRQAIDDVRVEEVPIDVSLVLDTSGSTAGGLSSLVTDTRAIAGRLRSIDRFRVLTIDTYVYEVLPMRPPTAARWPSRLPFNGASAVYDALAAAMIAPVDVDRRHLVVAMTDGQDTISVLDAADLKDIASRSDAVLHIALVRLPSAASPVPRNWLARRDRDIRALDAIASVTGGELHGGESSGTRVVDAFDRVFADFRQSYVLRYQPQRVRPQGWHAIDVKVARQGGYTVRARRGYFGASR